VGIAQFLDNYQNYRYRRRGKLLAKMGAKFLVKKLFLKYLKNTL